MLIHVGTAWWGACCGPAEGVQYRREGIRVESVRPVYRATGGTRYTCGTKGRRWTCSSTVIGPATRSMPCRIRSRRAAGRGVLSPPGPASGPGRCDGAAVDEPRAGTSEERAVANPAAAAVSCTRVVASVLNSIVEQHEMLDSTAVSRVLGKAATSRNTASRDAALLETTASSPLR
ncbi:conserved hypothetical protein [Rhodococcus jostii RHA1]|uniref:Uncharacterized protein n=1 Tax=Rhodococcus jostii (strain RHA1) TaxID=101510 RepID=Q0SJT7_RHOJR|nr:conserved hypothetical protein [Rhodococcus jostii RHA1]